MPFIRMCDICDSDLSPQDKVETLAKAMEDLALAHAMLIVHGDGWERHYIRAGGLVRFDDEGEPCIWITHNTAQAVVLDV